MNKHISIILLSLLVLSIITGCKKEKESPMTDMDNIREDGSHDDKYIFRKEIEKDERREKRYKKDKF